jgi:hypothetical protein
VGASAGVRVEERHGEVQAAGRGVRMLEPERGALRCGAMTRSPPAMASLPFASLSRNLAAAAVPPLTHASSGRHSGGA